MWSSRHFEDLLDNPSMSPSEIVRVAAKHFHELTEVKLKKKEDFLKDDMHRLLESRPGMGAVLNLVNSALLELESTPPDEMGSWFTDWIKAWERAMEGIRNIGAALIPANARVLTVSRSTNVLRLLEMVAKMGLSPRVVCGESYPGGEGRVMAKKVAEIGLKVDFYPDAALSAQVASCDIVLVGAMAVGHAAGMSSVGLIAKTGTLSVLQAAKAHRILAYAVVPPEAIVPISLSKDLRLPRSGYEDIWPDPPPRVMVKGGLVEWSPLDYVNGVLSEGGAVEAMELLAQKASVPRAEALAELSTEPVA